MLLRLAIGAAVFSISAIWGAVGASDTTVDTSPPEIPDASDGETVAAAALGVGDCIMWPEDDEDFAMVERRPCSVNHDAELFGTIDHPAAPDSEFPGTEAIAEWSAQACHEAFASYVGVTFDESYELDFSFFTPTELGWRKLDDRTVQCVVHDFDGDPLQGSVRIRA
jgi:hypothetical protein